MNIVSLLFKLRKQYVYFWSVAITLYLSCIKTISNEAKKNIRIFVVEQIKRSPIRIVETNYILFSNGIT